MKVDCPTCQRAIEWTSENPFRPFCSKKCQLIDLGQWANESHAIPCSPETDNNPDIDPELIEEMLAKQQDSFFSN